MTLVGRCWHACEVGELLVAFGINVGKLYAYGEISCIRSFEVMAKW